MGALILIMAILSLLVGCADGGSSSTGSGRAPIFSEEVDHARKVIRPYYPEASYMPAAFSGAHPEWWAWYTKGVIYLSQQWLEATSNNWRTSCTLVHEWWHSTQRPAAKNSLLFKANELDARRVEDECLRKIR